MGVWGVGGNDGERKIFTPRLLLPISRCLEEERQARLAAEREAREAWQATAAATTALEQQSVAMQGQVRVCPG